MIEQVVVDRAKAIIRAMVTAPGPGQQAQVRIPAWRLLSDYEKLFETIGAAKALLPPGPDPINKLVFCDWFNYFLADAWDLLTPVERGQLSTVVFALSIEGAGANQNLKVDFSAAPVGKARSDFLVAGDPVDAALARAVLKSLLDTGFRTATLGSASDFLPATAALEANTGALPGDHADIPGFRFIFRGDSRSKAEITAHSGAKVRADLGFWRADNNIDADWHPWRGMGLQPGNATPMYFRLGNKDNDYYTVNSVGARFEIACAYPIIRWAELSGTLKGPVDAFSDGMKLTLTGHPTKKIFIQPAFGPNRTRVLLAADTVNVYLCAIPQDERIANTGILGNGYPEFGVQSIPVSQFIAVFSVLRLHHPPAPGNAYDSTAIAPAMTIHISKWEWFSNAQTIVSALGCTEAAITALTARFNAQLGAFDNNHLGVRSAARYFPSPL